MRKNKRNLLVAIASMGLVAAGTGAVSTFAWYNANTSSTVAGVSQSQGTITTQKTPTEASTIYVSVEIAVSANPIALSTSDAYSYGLLNGDVVEAPVTSNKYAVKIYETATLSVKFWEENTMVHEITDGDERLSNITTATKTVTIGVTGRAKVAEYNSTYNTDDCKKAAHYWGDTAQSPAANKITFGTSVTLKLNLVAGTNVADCWTLKDSTNTNAMTNVFYRIAGDSSDSDHSTVEGQANPTDDGSSPLSNLGAITSAIA